MGNRPVPDDGIRSDGGEDASRDGKDDAIRSDGGEGENEPVTDAAGAEDEDDHDVDPGPSHEPGEGEEDASVSSDGDAPDGEHPGAGVAGGAEQSPSAHGPGRGFAAVVGSDPLASHFDGGPPVDIDTLLELLANPGRRYVLTYLILADEPVSTAELVEYIAVETALDAPSERLREEIAAELVEQQLPALARAGYIQYNRTRQLSGATTRTKLALPYLHLAKEQVSRAAGEDP